MAGREQRERDVGEDYNREYYLSKKFRKQSNINTATLQNIKFDLLAVCLTDVYF